MSGFGRSRAALGGLVAAALLVLAAVAPFAARAGEATDKLVADARRKVRQQDASGAIKILEQVIAAEPANVDAHILYQDVFLEVSGRAPLLDSYKKRAAAAPNDPVPAFLAARLLPADQAIPEFDRQTTAFPASPWAHAGKARALEDLGRHSDAAVQHDAALQRAGADEARFRAYRAFGLERAGNFPDAIEQWKAVLAKNAGDPTARYGLGDSLRRASRHDEAIAILDEARKAAPTDAEPSYRIALVHADAKRFDDALKAFDAAIALDKGMLEALCGAAEASLAKARKTAETEKRDLAEKDFESAVGYADRATAASPESAYAHFTRGAVCETVGELNADRLDEALKEYDAALERIPIPGPAKVRALSARSYVLLRLGRWEEALDAAQKALDIDKTCASAWGHAGHALAAQGKQADAISKYYKPGIKACPDDARLLHDLGVAHREMKKPNDAKKPLEDARKLEPKNGLYRKTLGDLYFELGRWKDSVTELFEATELLPRDAEAWLFYARACYAAKFWKESAEAWEKAIELDPESDASIEAHLYAAVIWADQLKDKKKAKPHIEEFLKRGGSDPNLQSWMDGILQDAAKDP